MRHVLFLVLLGCSEDTGADTDESFSLTSSGGELSDMGLSDAALNGYSIFADRTGSGISSLDINSAVTVYENPSQEWVDEIVNATWRGQEVIRYEFYRVDLEEIGLSLNEVLSGITHNNQITVSLFSEVDILLETDGYDLSSSLWWSGFFPLDENSGANNQANLQMTHDHIITTIVYDHRQYKIWTKTDGPQPIFAIVELD